MTELMKDSTKTDSIDVEQFVNVFAAAPSLAGTVCHNGVKEGINPGHN